MFIHICMYMYMYTCTYSVMCIVWVHTLLSHASLYTVGHGRSEGDRVHVETVDSYVQDIIHRVELMKSDYPHLPCILMGHSMVHTYTFGATMSERILH